MTTDFAPRMRNLSAPPGESQSIIRYGADSKSVSVFAPLRGNTTSSTKPEVHNVWHCHQRTKPQPHITSAENFAKFGGVVLEIFERTDRLTYTLISILRTAPGRRGEVCKYVTPSQLCEILLIQSLSKD